MEQSLNEQEAPVEMNVQQSQLDQTAPESMEEQKRAGSPIIVENEPTEDPLKLDSDVPDEESSPRQGTKRKSEPEEHDENKKIMLDENDTPEVTQEKYADEEIQSPPSVDIDPVPENKEQSPCNQEPTPQQPESYQPHWEEFKQVEPECPAVPEDGSVETPQLDLPAPTDLPDTIDEPAAMDTTQPKELTDPLSLHEKLREMGEISVKPVSKSTDPASAPSKPKEEESEVSVEIKKKSSESDEIKRITNLRKNIREVMDENQLDATTLAAQRQESERLARVQVQQKLIRDITRQMAVERHNNRTQNRVLSLLQGQTSISRGSSSASADRTMPASSAQPILSDEHTPSSDMYIVKGVASEVTFKGSNFVDVDKFSMGNLTPSVSIAPVRRPRVYEDSDMSGDESEIEEDLDKKDVVEIVDSSSDDDCIVLSDDEEEEEETEDDPHNSGLHVKDAYNIPDEQGRVLINIGHPENEEDIFLAPQIARIIKPHQIGGVRFLYDNIIESTERFNSSTGFGCILAHSMGLGKTLQVVCFCDIFLRHTDSKSILCILPINTLQNWMSEFNMWMPEDPEKSPLAAHGEVRPRNFKIYVLNDQQKSLGARSKVILEWAKTGGVLLIGYELFRLLSLKLANKKKKSKKGNCEKERTETEAYKRTMDEIHAALVKPGPDLVMCDEGHRIKNSHASISVALKQIRSKRRIVLTGYPLQNNLLEYWCMVDFVRPNYLGTKTEFANMFERPIQNGQCIDSTPQDIKLMRYRAHVLHSLLVGFVQRRSHVVLQNSLPQKEEYVILVRMTSFQRKLYNTFMNEVVRTKAVPNPLKAFAVCCKIWNHPDVLYNFLKKREADLDLEEVVEAEANPPTPAADATETLTPTASTPATNNRGRKKGTPNKTTKGVNKNGKTIPAVEVQPNQSKLPTQTADKSNEGTPIKTEKETETPAEIKEESQPAETQTAAEMMPPPAALPPPAETQPTPNNYPAQAPAYPPTQLNNSVPPSLDPTNSAQPPPSYPPYPPSQYPNQAPPNPHYPGNYNNPYNPYEYDGYYSGQYGNMYPPPAPPGPQHQQYPNNPYDQSYNAQNNYWPNNYYGYNNPNQMNSDPYGQSDPSYAGLVPKATESFDNAQPPSSEEKSSEIVDLDTKEIKTVEASHVEPEIKKEDDEEPEVKVKTETPENDEKKPEKPAAVKKEKDIKKEKKEKDEVIEEAVVPLTPEKETTRSNAKEKDDGIPYDWAVELMKGYVPDLLENSPKMVIFMHLLEECVKMGDRILVFSQSLLTLNLIERFLQKTLVPGFDYNWAKNTTYFRLDGSTSAIEREKLINEFNANPHVHLFLVSTRAGSLGINLVGANRVVVFDASWNPCHDTQAVCRVYRYGQKKPCFVYRIVMDNCLEKKIYDRQINKQGMSDRVVDECNPDAHLSMKEVTNLCYDNDGEDDEIKDFTDCKEKYLDVIMQKILELHSDLLSKEPFHHESLLVDRKEKKLSQAEKRLAQRGYEMEKRASAKPSYVYHSMGTQYRIMKTPDGSVVHRPVASVRPMQADPEKGHFTRPGGVRPTRWIPAEVWQRQGMTAQEMTLPLDVVIPTSSGDKSNIVLKAGQKVMVLKSPKGIYMQLETGKIIAIRTSFKMGQNQHNKEKADVSDAGTSNIAGSDDVVGKPSGKMDVPFTSPSNQGTNNTSNAHGNSMSGKQSNYTMETSARSAKSNDTSTPHPQFKANNMSHHRNTMHHPSTNNSKNFNVQNLIDTKPSMGSQNANVFSHSMMADASRSGNNPVPTISKQSLYNAATKANYPRSNYSFTNALKQAHSHGNASQSLMANVKPQMQDAKMWEANKNQSGKNSESHLPTITIDDDIEPPLREKVVYKPNLIERKMKQPTPKNMPHLTGISASSNAPNYVKQTHGKNALPQTQTSGGGNFKGPESLRQMHNVKPYNRQYGDQRNGSAANKTSGGDDSMASTSTAQQDAKNTSGARSKMPSIRNIPAPYPSISMASSKVSTSNAHNAPTYTQSSMSSSSRESGANTTYTSGSNTQSHQENSEYNATSRTSSQYKPENEKAPEPATEKQQKMQSNLPPSASSSHAQQNTQSQSSHPPTSNSASTTPSANSDSQYSSYSHHHQPTTSAYSTTEQSYNYPRSEYQQSYSDMYASGPPNPYGYAPAAQHHPSQQSSYPYGSYYDHQMYGNANAQSYGGASSGAVPAPAVPSQHGQYHYSTYQPPPPNVPPQSADPYNSYFNYPPYPPQAGQWQQ